MPACVDVALYIALYHIRQLKASFEDCLPAGQRDYTDIQFLIPATVDHYGPIKLYKTLLHAYA